MPVVELSLLAAFAIAVLFGLLPLSAAGFVAMRGTVEWFVAKRYLFAKRPQTFIGHHADLRHKGAIP
jgi:hypothetical protein